jgi:hypothetical protein
MTNNLLVNLMRHMGIWLNENPPIYRTAHVTFCVSSQLTSAYALVLIPRRHSEGSA